MGGRPRRDEARKVKVTDWPRLSRQAPSGLEASRPTLWPTPACAVRALQHKAYIKLNIPLVRKRQREDNIPYFGVLCDDEPSRRFYHPVAGLMVPLRSSPVSAVSAVSASGGAAEGA